MSKRNFQEINAGSMADIAFLLLIFFLVTTTMDTDLGITRKLPPIHSEKPPEVHKRNTFTVLVNSENNLLVQGESVKIAELRSLTKEFIENPENLETLPVRKERTFSIVGTMEVTPNHIISLQSHRGTSYGTFIAVQNELAAAYNELRDNLAQEHWGVSFDELSPENRDIVLDVYPSKISEAEPVQIASVE